MSQGSEFDFSQVLHVFDERRASAVSEAREAAIGEAERLMPGIVRSSVDAAFPGNRGRVASWQNAYVGTKRGYVAVRAKSDEYVVTRSGGRYAVGHITNALEHGHRTRRPSGKAKRYAPRLKTAGTVPGRFFYKNSAALMENVSAQLAAIVEKKMGEVLERD